MSTRIFCNSTFRMSAALWVAVMLCLTLATGVAAASYTVTITGDGTNAVGAGSYAAGAAVSVNAGHHPKGLPFRVWTSQNDSVKFSDAYSEKTTFVMPERDVTVTAEFGGVGKRLASAEEEDSIEYGDEKYGWVTIGSRKWMTKNLNYQPDSGNSWCNGTADSCVKYGRLYDWTTAMGLEKSNNTKRWGPVGNFVVHGGICPAGWRIPNKNDWEALVAEAGTNPGAKLRAKSGWSSNTGTDDYGFAVLPGGSYNAENKTFINKGVGGFWWMSTEANVTDAFFVRIDANNAISTTTFMRKDTRGFSVRCVAFAQKYTVNIIRKNGTSEIEEYDPGETVTITAGTAPEGMMFTVWSTESKGVTFAGEDVYKTTVSFVMPENDVTLTEVFGRAVTFTDSRDGKSYRSVKMDGKWWMAENLNYNTGKEASLCDGSATDYCGKYGRLYDWTTAMNTDEEYKTGKWDGDVVKHQGICPAGWYLPDTAIWAKMIEDLGGSELASVKLRRIGAWNASVGGGTNGADVFGFSALPGGFNDWKSGDTKGWGYWWLVNDDINDGNWAYDVQMMSNSVAIERRNKNWKISVRCVADKLPVAKPTVETRTFDWTGSPIKLGIAEHIAYNVEDGEKTNAGDYTAKVILVDTANYVWSDGTKDVLEISWEILPATGEFVTKEINATYSTGLKLSHLTLPDGYAWDSTKIDPDTIHLHAGYGQPFAAFYTDPDSSHTAASGDITVNVAKAPTGLTAAPPEIQVIQEGMTGPRTFDLSDIVLTPTDHGKLSYSEGDIIDTGKILKNAPTITGDKLLNYQGSGKSAGTATQVVVIASDNYEDITVVVTFEATPQVTYAVTVDSGAAVYSRYPEDAVVTITASPGLPGRTFDEWTTADGVTFADAAATPTTFAMPPKAVRVTAAYRDTIYTITFITDGGAVSPDFVKTVAGSGKPASLPAPTKTGYTFAGWYLTDASVASVDTSWAFSADAALIARWTLNRYTVTWNENGGTPVPEQKYVNHGESIAAPEAMTKTGHAFGGWYTDSDFTPASAKTLPITNVTGNTTLYAKWTINTYSVTWHTNGATPLPLTSFVNYGGSITAPPIAVAKTGYVLESWCLDSGLTVAEVFPISDVTAAVNLYAKWTPVYTVTFNPNSGTVDPASGKTGAGGKLASLPEPTRDGYKFDGWFTELTDGEAVTINTVFGTNSVIHARWTLITYTITFNPNGGYLTPGTPTSVTIGAGGGTLASLPTPKRDGGGNGAVGYAFDGWYTGTGTGGTQITTSTVFNNFAILYAHWKPLYKISFIVVDGTVARAADTTDADGRLASLPTPTSSRNGYAFSGWYTEITGGTKITTGTVFTATATLYAQWVPVGVSFTISFNANGGTVSPASRVTTGNGTLSALPAPARSGYEFTGWYTTASSSVGVEVTTETVFEATSTIYARWKPVYTVTFNANGGTVSPASARAEDDGTVASWPVPARAGYEFNGWFTTSAAAGGAEITPDHVFTANTTIYARWTLVTYTIVFDPNGGTVSKTSDVTGIGGRLASIPTPSSRTGYVFDGWFTESEGGAKVTTSTAFTGDAVIYAHWSAIYTITFNPNGGTVATTTAKTVAGGKLASLPTPLTRAGYTFVGWFTEEDGGTPVTTSTVFDADAVVYAQWSLFTKAKVTFSAGANGTLRASVDGIPIATGDSIGIGKTVVFTAVPSNGYKVARWTINGKEEVVTTDTSWYMLPNLSNTTAVSVTFESKISVASPDREIPSGGSVEETAIVPVKTLPGVVTVGPNPVRSGSDAAIYWTGGKAVSGRLSVFNAVGQKVAAVNVSGVNKIGTWRVGDVAEGTYLIKGVLMDKNGVKVVVSQLVGVVR